MRQRMTQLSIHCCTLLLLLLLAGCIGRSQWAWQHPAGYGETERQQAIAECEMIATEESSRYDYYLPDPFFYDRYYFRGQHLYYWPGFYRYDWHRERHEYQRFFRTCMKAKGWRLIKLPQPPAN